MIGPQDAEEPGEGEDPSPELLDGAIDRAAIDPHGRDVGILDRQGEDRQLTRIDRGTVLSSNAYFAAAGVSG